MLNIYITSAIRKEGKTLLTAGLAVTMQSLGYNTAVYKPVQTAGHEMNGFMQSPDLTLIKSLDPYINTKFTYLFKENCEPLIASEKENTFIDVDLIHNDYKKIKENSDCIILDGESGIMSPLAPSIQTADMVRKLQIPALFVVKPTESTLSALLPAIYSALDKKVKVQGVVINNIEKGCPKELLTSITRIVEEYSGVNILGLVPEVKNTGAPEELITAILNGVDIESIFGVKIEKLEFTS